MVTCDHRFVLKKAKILGMPYPLQLTARQCYFLTAVAKRDGMSSEEQQTCGHLKGNHLDILCCCSPH